MGELGKVYQANLSAHSDVSSSTESSIGVLNAVGGQAKANANFDFVGINENGVEFMKEAVDRYCNKVETKINEMLETAKTDDVFRGEYAAAITEFVTAVKDSALYNVRLLKKFKADLEQVKAAYKAKDSSLSSGVSDNASSIRGSVESN